MRASGLVREYFGLKFKQTVAVWSVLQTIVSVVGLVLTLVLWNLTCRSADFNAVA